MGREWVGTRDLRWRSMLYELVFGISKLWSWDEREGVVVCDSDGYIDLWNYL